MPELPVDETAPSFHLGKFRFSKLAAVFYHQAKEEGRISEFFELIDKLNKDLWPADAGSQTVRCQRHP